LEPLLAGHNKENFEIFCYAEVSKPDDMTERFKEYADHWRSTVELDDDELEKQIRDDAIDVIIECTGRTNNNRLTALSRKPAPIQVSYFTMHGRTTGMVSMDYAIGDRALIPPEYEDQFSEKVIHLEHGAFPFLPDAIWPEVAPPREDDEGRIFACVGDPARISASTVDLWARLLDRVPGAQLILKHQSYDDPQTLVHWQRKFEKLGDRVVFEDLEGGWGRHMEIYGRIDVILDTIPMSGGTTCAIPLWMGVPVVNIASHYTGHRVGMSIIINSGFSEFVAESDEEYLKIASELINDRKRLATFRSEIREKMSKAPICNIRAQVKDLESALREMWKAWCVVQKI
jgi:predicted O-linked N-acetylglucosamine transferase (SPINDLY family)